MAQINIQIPALDAEHSIEIDVRINGNKKRYKYRVELFYWDDCADPDNHAECLKEKIKDYDQRWTMVQIGGPTKESVPVMFKQISV